MRLSELSEPHYRQQRKFGFQFGWWYLGQTVSEGTGPPPSRFPRHITKTAKPQTPPSLLQFFYPAMISQGGQGGSCAMLTANGIEG